MLTPSERRLLKLIAEYKTNKEIAKRLCISARTVEHHRSNICENALAKGSHALLKFAIEYQTEAPDAPTRSVWSAATVAAFYLDIAAMKNNRARSPQSCRN